MGIFEEIKTALNNCPAGMSAREIARNIGRSKSEVNSVLYANQEVFRKDSSYVPQWTLINGISYSENDDEELDPVLLKLQNRDDAEYYTYEEFDELADWAFAVGHSENYNPELVYVTEDGNTIICDSKSEVKMLEYLEENSLVQGIGGQSLKIEYDSLFREGLSYYPDIVALTNDGHIAIIEVKPVTAMDNHANIEKYDALKNYCEENGFMYMMVDPDSKFMTYEELYDMDVIDEIVELFDEWNDFIEEDSENYVKFDDKYVDEQYALIGSGLTKKEFRLQMHSMVLYNRWYNVYKNGFKVYSCPVKIGNNREVLEVYTDVDF